MNDTSTRVAQADTGVVIVSSGDTLYAISRRHNVAVKDMIALNGLAAPYGVKVGQKLTLPGSGSARNAAFRPRPAQKSAAMAKSHRVRSGETLYGISVNYGIKPVTLASYNGISAPYRIKTGQVIKLPGSKMAARTALTRKAGPARTTGNTSRVRPVAKVAATGRNNVKRATLKRRPHTGPLPKPEPMASNSFRWPVKGRIISQFGSQSNGTRNDGINLAVPAGTTVKSAENGVVAYAGNELRGYGNLVLIRHAGGWVTAYAHNSRLFVRRGDKIKRGQIIAKAGQTGSVTRPQLHFEIRKGAKAVDPVRHLAPTHVATPARVKRRS